MDLDAYRESAETFLYELGSEHYRHYAGLQESYEIEPIYERHRGLFTRAAIEGLHELLQQAHTGTDEERRRRMLLDFAVEGFIGEATKGVEADLARTEATLEIEIGGRALAYREAAVAQANEPDANRREEIEQARLALTAEPLGPLYREMISVQHGCAVELGWPGYVAMCEECKGIDLPALALQTAAFSAASETRYSELVDPELRRTLGIGLHELRRGDLPRFFRAAEQDGQFPADRLAASFIETMSGMGIDVAAQRGVTFDLEARPMKSPRAFCAPVRVPGEVYLVVTPMGGRDDYAALFHEGGHAEHAANVDPDLPFEFRYLGDNSISETYAFLMQHLVENGEWLTRQLGIEDPSRLLAHARAQRLVYVRRYAAKLAYEFQLHSAGPGTQLDGLAGRYAQLLGDAVKVSWPPETFLADVDPGFYCACYLRAWALETHLRAHLEERFGPTWFESAEAGQVVRRLWSDGQRLDAEELLGELSGERLHFGAVLADLGLT
jgi:hypothetical protein